MPTSSPRPAALLLALAAFAFAPAGPARAADVIDHSNSGSSATGSPFAFQLATSRNSFGASPMDDSRSASATGNPRAFPIVLSQNNPGSSPADNSNSASALGGPGTASRTPPGARFLASLAR